MRKANIKKAHSKEENRMVARRIIEEFFKKYLKSLLEAVVITKLETHFPKEFISQPGWINFHNVQQPFENLWGRFAIGSKKLSDGTYETLIGNYGTSHAQLKSHLSGEGTLKTGYWGFSKGILYLENASVGANVNWTNDVLKSIAMALTESGPLRGCQFKLK